MRRCFSFFAVMSFLCISTVFISCAPVEYSVVIVNASDAIEKAEAAGAACTEQQLADLSPTTRYDALESGTELASTEAAGVGAHSGTRCAAPFEYYSALEYLSKAREEVGYSDYQAALKYARQAREYARRAREIALQAGRESEQ